MFRPQESRKVNALMRSADAPGATRAMRRFEAEITGAFSADAACVGGAQHLQFHGDVPTPFASDNRSVFGASYASTTQVVWFIDPPGPKITDCPYNNHANWVVQESEVSWCR